LRHVVGAGLAAGVEFVGGDVDGDHARVRPFRHHHLMDADAAAGADDRHRLAALDLRAAQHLVGRRQRVGDDAHFRRMLLVVEPIGVLDEDMRGQLDVFGIAAVAFKTDVAVAVHAERLQLRETKPAMAAVEIEISRDAVALFEPRHAGSERDDLAGDFVPDDARKFDLPAASLGVLDGQARAASDDARDRLARTGRGIRHLHHFERGVGPPQHHRFHANCPRLLLSRLVMSS
jgi:hypothetical protein